MEDIDCLVVSTIFNIYDMIYLLTVIGLTPGGSSTVQYSTVQYSTVQYTEQHNETEYTERNIHNNKNT
jgi:hypothetical protein